MFSHHVHPPCLNVGMSLGNVMHPPSQQQDVFRRLKGCGFFHIIGEWVQKFGCHLHHRPIVLSVVGCVDGLIIVATLAHELF
jgi:hypothetical protein